MHSSKLATASSRRSSSQIEYSEIVQRFRVSGTRLQCPLQILVGALGIVSLRKDHTQTVIRFGIVRTDYKRALKSFAGFIPLFLQTISIAQIVECNQMIGT